MTSPRQHFWKIPSLEDVIFLTIFGYLILNPTELLHDGDTGFHIRAGEWMIQNLRLPSHDLFSFYLPTPPWSNHSWLTQVLMGGLHLFAGLRGVVLLYAGLLAFLGFFLFRVLNRLSGEPLIPCALGTLALINTMSHWHARPHIFSMILTLLWLDGVLGYLNQGRKWIFWAGPLAMLFWVNLHGGFLLGFVILGLVMTGLVLEMVSKYPDSQHVKIHKIKNLGLLGLGLIPAALLNPNGFQGVLYPIQMMMNPELLGSVDEYLAPNFHSSVFLAFQLFLFLWILLAGFKVKILRGHEILLVLFFLKMALSSKRHVPLFGLVSAYLLTPYLAEMFYCMIFPFAEHFKNFSMRLQAVQFRCRPGIWALGGGVILLGAVFLRNEPVTFDPKKFPEKAADYVLKHPPQGNMFNENGFGSYLIYKLWPEHKVFAYGFNDIYSLQRMRDYRSVMALTENWQDVLREQNVSWIFLRSNSPLKHFFKASSWTQVYSDDCATIYVLSINPTGSLNASISGSSAYDSL